MPLCTFAGPEYVNKSLVKLNIKEKRKNKVIAILIISLDLDMLSLSPFIRRNPATINEKTKEIKPKVNSGLKM